jgi:hypothetical protein
MPADGVPEVAGAPVQADRATIRMLVHGNQEQPQQRRL